MSFSYNTKSEICRLMPESKCCAVAECYGMLLFGNLFTSREIRIITGNRAIGERIIERFSCAFSIDFDYLPREGARGKQQYVIIDREKLRNVFEVYGFSMDKLLALHVNLSVLEEECCRRSYIRGAFLTGGAVTDPAKSYHLELVTAYYYVSR